MPISMGSSTVDYFVESGMLPNSVYIIANYEKLLTSLIEAEHIPLGKKSTPFVTGIYQ